MKDRGRREEKKTRLNEGREERRTKGRMAISKPRLKLQLSIDS